FFFQAEDGIRDFHVTGVQTCALPICTKFMALVSISLPDDARMPEYRDSRHWALVPQPYCGPEQHSPPPLYAYASRLADPVDYSRLYRQSLSYYPPPSRGALQRNPGRSPQL